MMTRLETTTRLCELVAEIEEIRSNTKSTWFVYGELQEVGARVQQIIKDIQEGKEARQ